jgi:hypothetical protein
VLHRRAQGGLLPLRQGGEGAAPSSLGFVYRVLLIKHAFRSAALYHEHHLVNDMLPVVAMGSKRASFRTRLFQGGE